jgi:hypothetical protein
MTLSKRLKELMSLKEISTTFRIKKLLIPMMVVILIVPGALLLALMLEFTLIAIKFIFKKLNYNKD